MIVPLGFRPLWNMANGKDLTSDEANLKPSKLSIYLLFASEGRVDLIHAFECQS